MALEGAGEEAPLPDEVRRTVTASVAADVPTAPATARPGQVLQVLFTRADEARLVEAFEALRAVVASRPGETSVLLFLPGSGGRTQQMQLRTGVAYDAELVAEIERSLGGLVSLQLS